TGVYTIQSGTVPAVTDFALTFDNVAADATISHSGSNSDTIAAPVLIAGNGNLVLTNNITGTLTLSGSVSSALSSGTQILTGTGSAGIAFTGPVSNGVSGGTVAIAKSGAGLLTLSGSNTYSGGTTIGGGPVLASNSSAL